MINQNKKASVKRFIMNDDDDDFPPSKVSKDSSLKLLITDREEISN